MSSLPFSSPGELSYVLVCTAPAQEHKVYTALKKVSEVVERHPLFGEYDLILKVEAKDYNALGHVVVDKIKTIPGVISAITLVAVMAKDEPSLFRDKSGEWQTYKCDSQ